MGLEVGGERLQGSCVDGLGVCSSPDFIRWNLHAIAGRSEFAFIEMASFKGWGSWDYIRI